MYIIMVYSLRVKKQAQFILKIATVQEILQKNKREIALVNLSVRRVSTHRNFVLPPLYASFSALSQPRTPICSMICSMRSGLFCLRLGAHSKRHPYIERKKVIESHRFDNL